MGDIDISRVILKDVLMRIIIAQRAKTILRARALCRVAAISLGAFLLVTTTMACNKGPAKSTQSGKTTAKSKITEELKVVGSWFLDNKTCQEPMLVPDVTTTSPNTLLVALIASDSGQGPERGGPPLDGKIQSVEGGGLKWIRQAEAHLSVTSEPGIAEIWTAYAPKTIAPFTVTVTRNNDTGSNTLCNNFTGGPGPEIANGMVLVQAIVGADPKKPIGATAVAGVGKMSNRVAAASVSLTTTRAGSIVEAVGSDWDGSIPRTLPTGQTLLHENVSTHNNDNYWTQGLSDKVAKPGPVSLSVTEPTDHACNMAAIEILQAP